MYQQEAKKDCNVAVAPSLLITLSTGPQQALECPHKERLEVSFGLHYH